MNYGGSPIHVVFLASCSVAFTSTPATIICRRGPRIGKSHLTASVLLYTNWRTAIAHSICLSGSIRHGSHGFHEPSSPCLLG